MFRAREPGVLRYDVSQRTREMAIRLALGARRTDIVRSLVRRGLFAPLAGAVAGITGALWLTRIMSHLLFETSATDPATYAGVAGLVVFAAVLASYPVARKAARVDPIETLKSE